MRTHYTFWFEDGAIWHWKNTGVFKPRFEAFARSRDLAQKLHDEFAERALVADYFQSTASDFRDELAEAIKAYDEFHQPLESTSYGTDKEQYHECHV